MEIYVPKKILKYVTPWVIKSLWSILLMAVFLIPLTLSMVDKAEAAVPAIRLLLTVAGVNGTANGQAKSPIGVGLDAAGNIYVADTLNYRVQKFNSAGTYIGKFGLNATTDGNFKNPSGVAIDSSGNIYVADSNNHRIQKFNSSFVYQWKVGGIALGSGNGQFKYPRAITFDKDGNLLVLDGGNSRVQRLTTDGVYISQFSILNATSDQFGAYGMFVDSSGSIWIADTPNHLIKKFDNEGNLLLQFGVYGTGLSQLRNPSGVAVDSQGFIYVSDTFNSKLKKYNSNGDLVAYYTTNLSQPRHIVIDSNDNLFVAEVGGNAIRKFDFNGSAFQITNLSPNLDILNTADGLSVAQGSIYGTSNASASLRIKSTNGLTISDATINMTADRDWSTLDAGSDLATGKSFIKNLIGSSGSGATHTLYVPVPEGRTSQSVYICPQADSYLTVSTSCPDGVRRSAGAYSETFGEIVVSKVDNLGDKITYWKIVGMTGSGGLADELLVYSGNGNGTLESPYQITSCSQLQEMKDNKASHFEIANDIDCSDSINWNGGSGFIPVGTINSPFTGSLVGNTNFTISNIYILISSDGAGLIGYANGADFEDVHLENLLYQKGTTGYDAIGGLVGYMNGGTIINSSTDGYIQQTNNSGLNATFYVGGLVGYGTGITVTDSSSSADITMLAYGGYSIGGLIGEISGNSLVEDSFAIGDVSTGRDSYQNGGFIGWMVGNSTVNRCYSTGTVHVGVGAGVNEGYSYDHGGFVGGMGGSQSNLGTTVINDSYTTSTVIVDGTTNYDVGGFIGTLYESATINSSFASGSVTVSGSTSRATGGFVGLTRQRYAGSSPTITNSYSTGSVHVGLNGAQVGGFVGEHRNGTIEDSYATGNVSAQDIGDELEYTGPIGGFAGETGDAQILRSFAAGDVSGIGEAELVGGFIGWINGLSVIDQCASFGDVSGYDDVGGFIGMTNMILNRDGTISNSFSRGNVIATYGDEYSTLGGFIGTAERSEISNSYSTGSISTLPAVVEKGGFAGDNYLDYATITSSFWDNQSSGIISSDGGTGVGTSQMKTEANFIGWDFVNVWGLNPSINDGYPFLPFQNTWLNLFDTSLGSLTDQLSPGVLNYEITTSSQSSITFNLGSLSPLINNITVNGVTVILGSESQSFSLVDGQNVFEIIITYNVVPGVTDDVSRTYSLVVNNGEVEIDTPVEDEAEVPATNDDPDTLVVTGNLVEVSSPTPVDNPDTDIEADEDVDRVVVDDISKEPVGVSDKQESEDKKLILSATQKSALSILTILILDAIGTQIGFVKGNLWFAFAAIIDRIKKRKPWGIVYDSISKQNIPQAIVRLFSFQTGKLVDTVVTDGLGIFKLAIEKGRYKMLVSKFGYNFPTKVIFSNNDGQITNVYKGGDIVIKKDGGITMLSIPIDPEHENALIVNLKRLFSIAERVLEVVSPLLLVGGTIYTLAITISNPYLWNYLILSIYLFVIVTKAVIFFIHPKAYGKVTLEGGDPIANCAIGLYEADFDRLVAQTLTNEIGQYNFIVQNRDYILKVLDPGYEVVQGGGFIEGTSYSSGPLLINGDLRVRTR